jgi:hypothetical protein
LAIQFRDALAQRAWPPLGRCFNKA